MLEVLKIILDVGIIILDAVIIYMIYKRWKKGGEWFVNRRKFKAAADGQRNEPGGIGRGGKCHTVHDSSDWAGYKGSDNGTW